MRITKPRQGEPIRLVETKTGTRYRAVLTVGRHADGRRRQVTTTHSTLGEARDWVSETRLNVKRGVYNAPDRTDVDALCTAWASSKRDVRPVTLNTYESVLKPVRRRLGALKVQEVRRSDLETFVTCLSAEGGRHGLGVSHRTTSLTLQVLKSVFAYAVSEGVIQTSPAADVKAPRKRPEDHRQVTVWNEAQLDRFVEHADSDRWGAL